jgi:hypothetical protein
MHELETRPSLSRGNLRPSIGDVANRLAIVRHLCRRYGAVKVHFSPDAVAMTLPNGSTRRVDLAGETAALARERRAQDPPTTKTVVERRYRDRPTLRELRDAQKVVELEMRQEDARAARAREEQIRQDLIRRRARS